MSLSFAESFLGRLRSVVGSRLLLLPSVRAVVLDAGGRILLHHRPDFRLWGLPGGHPEEGEALHGCIVREVEEETGLRLRSLEPFGFSSSPTVETVEYPNGHRTHSFALLVSSREWEGTLLQCSEESLEVRFFERGALPQELLPNEKRTLEAFFEFERTGQFQLF